eukprot:gene5413-6752_t
MPSLPPRPLTPEQQRQLQFEQSKQNQCIQGIKMGVMMGGMVGSSFGIIGVGLFGFMRGLRGFTLLTFMGRGALQSGILFAGFMGLESEKDDQQYNNNNNNKDSSYLPRFLFSSPSSSSDNEDQQKQLYIVQFKDIINDDVKNELVKLLKDTDTIDCKHPSRIINYIPDDSFLVVMSKIQSRLLHSKDWISWIGDYDSTHKLNQDHIFSSPIGTPILIQLAISKDLSPEIQSEIIDDLIQRWEKSIINSNHHCGGGGNNLDLKLEKVSNSKLKLTLKCNGGNSKLMEKSVYKWISEQFETIWMEPIEKVVSMNKFAPTVMMSKTNGSLVKNDRNDIPLRGKGQIIGVADTGIDKDHCFFSDPSQPFPINTINLNHRKIVTYINYQDDHDEVDGHGTHVAGSIAGSPADMTKPVGQYSGLAYDAKLAFFDLLKEGINSPTPPDDLKVMYQQIYNAGARIHGDSWGSYSIEGKNGAYSSPAADIDQFLYDHSDFLILRAAGNEGDDAFLSLLSQATAKNALVIGAQSQSYPSFESYVDFFNFEESAHSYMLQACSFDQKYCNYTSQQCCTESATVRGLTTCCEPSLKNLTIQSNKDLGPSKLNQNNVASFSSKGPTLDGRIKPDVIAPGLFVVSSRSNGNDTADQCGDGSLSNKALLALQGTSMATPLATAAVAILRQYLTEGYYPTGEPVENNKLYPTGALMKAFMINTANLVNGTYFLPADRSYPQANTGPIKGSSFSQGWGAINLGNGLYFKSGSGSNAGSVQPSIFIGGLEDGVSNSQWKEPSMSTGKSRNYCIRYRQIEGSTSQPKVKATLVWTDPASLPGALYNLVNNLDLTLRVVNIIYVGNENPPSYGPSSFQDRVNNVEQILFEPNITLPTTIMKFSVNGTNIPIGPQNYSIIISGTNGIYDWYTCPQCGPGEIQLCSVPHGEGSQHCNEADLQWGKCLINSCNNGYNYNSLTNSCDQFLSYNYIVMIVAGATMILISIVIGIIKYLEYRERKKMGNTDDGADSSGISIKPKSKDDKVSIPDLYALVSPFILELIIATAASLVSTAASILQPFYIGNIIQAIPTTTNISALRTDFIYIFLLAFFEFVFSTISSWITGIVNEKMIMKLQNKVFRAIIAQDMGFFQKNNAPTLMNVLIVDSPMLRSALTGILLAVATGVCKFVGSLVFIFSISWKLSLAFFATVPVLAIVTQIQSKFSKRLTRALLYYNSRASQQGSESMVNMHVVTNYCTQEKEIKKYASQLQDVFITARKLIINNTLAASVKWLMVESLAFTILYYGTYLSINKEFSVGLLISFSLYIGYVIESSNTLFGVYISYIQSLASATRVFMILRSAPRKRTTVCDSTVELTAKELKKKKKKEQEEYYKRTGISVVEMSLLPSSYIELTDVKGEIEFKDVNFRYPTRPDVQVLHNINIKLEPGKCYGLVGPSGSGKSTALELISKFYQLKEGTILLDGVDTGKIRPNNLRSFVTNVHQHPYLFDATIRENIGYALENPTMEEIIEAAKMANAHEFISELPNQYETELGSAGNLLSGGQKKRIAVARAICAKRKIMLLDEITAELDPESEEAITNSIKKLTQGHTVVMVAHKVAAVKECDRIFVLEKGHLVEQGTHDELISNRGRYYKMFHDRDDHSLELPPS